MSPYYWKVYVLFVLLALYPTGSQAMNISQCFANVINCAENSTSPNCTSTLNISSEAALSVLRMSNGSLPGSVEAATSISYTGCSQYCGQSTEDFSWNDFSQEFSAWLLPYLALLSQLPFGAHRRTDNLMSAVLTLGSPTLAAYSLYLTLLNARWLNDRLFSDIHYPSALVRMSVVRVLCSLQQVPLRVHPGEGQFESLVVHPDNDEWWTTFTQELEYSHTWSIASAINIIWVVIAYLLTVANSISNIGSNINSNGEGTGSGWLWLLPVVVGWLVLSPKCDYGRVLGAYDKANGRVFVADARDRTKAPAHVTSNFGLTIAPTPEWDCTNIISPDESRTPPVFNYARVLLWSQHVYVASLFYRTAFEKSNRRIAVDGESIPGPVHSDVPRGSRLGTCDQTIRYCRPAYYKYTGTSVLWPRGIFYNMIMASLMALLLQWGTTGAAVLTVFSTPTTGLGCRSVAYLMYGALSTIVWILLFLSSILGYCAHCLHHHHHPASDVESARTRPPPTPSSNSESGVAPSIADESPGLSHDIAPPLCELHDPCADMGSPGVDEPVSIAPLERNCTLPLRALVLARLADWLRWIGKTIALINAIGTIANSILQYAGVYNNCFCDSSVFTWGPRAFADIAPSSSDFGSVKSAWIGAFSLGLSSCGFFVGLIYLMKDSLPS